MRKTGILTFFVVLALLASFVIASPIDDFISGFTFRTTTTTSRTTTTTTLPRITITTTTTTTLPSTTSTSAPTTTTIPTARIQCTSSLGNKYNPGEWCCHAERCAISDSYCWRCPNDVLDCYECQADGSWKDRCTDGTVSYNSCCEGKYTNPDYGDNTCDSVARCTSSCETTTHMVTSSFSTNYDNYIWSDETTATIWIGHTFVFYKYISPEYDYVLGVGGGKHPDSMYGIGFPLPDVKASISSEFGTQNDVGVSGYIPSSQFADQWTNINTGASFTVPVSDLLRIFKCPGIPCGGAFPVPATVTYSGAISASESGNLWYHITFDATTEPTTPSTIISRPGEQTGACEISNSACLNPEGSINLGESITGCLYKNDWKYYSVPGSATKNISVTLTQPGTGCNFNDLYIFDNSCKKLFNSTSDLSTVVWSGEPSSDIRIGVDGDSSNPNCQWTLKVDYTPLSDLNCEECKVGNSCSCSVVGLCDLGVWVLRSTSLSEQIVSVLPPNTVTFTPVSTGEVDVFAVCLDPLTVKSTNVIVES